MNRVIWLAALCGVVMAESRPALACSCGVPVAVHPVHGESGVPINARIVVRDLNGAVRIEDVSGEVVEVEAERISYDGFRALWAFTPTTILNPGTEFVVFVDDVEVSRFSTGAERDTTGPEPVAVDDISATVTPTVCDTSCDAHDGAISHIAITARVSSDTSLVRVTFDNEESVIITADRLERFLSRHAAECETVPPRLAVGRTACMTLTAIDDAGNESSSIESCAEPTACAPPTNVTA